MTNKDDSYCDIITQLIKKNKELELKLLNASEWMAKNVEEKKDIINGNIEEIHTKDIKNTIINFLWEYPLGSDFENIIDDLLSSEILFAHFKKEQALDGTGVIIGYNKVLDFLIENNITSPFRKYAQKKCKNILVSKNHIESNLHSVIHKWYILSIGRLFEVVQSITFHYGKEEFYLTLFEKFLEEHPHIKHTLLEASFFEELNTLVVSEIFWSKRHAWTINFEETSLAREKIVWGFTNSNCILIKLLEIWRTF